MIDLLKVDSLDEAIDKLYNQCIDNNYIIDIEEIDVKDSYGRVLAEDIVSKIDVPEFDRSVVDGFAVIAKDTEGATESIPTFLNVVAESKMGEVCDININSGECVYVPTGAMLPKNADSCVMVEYVENITSKKIAVFNSVQTGKNIVKKADDIKKDDTVLKKGRIITAYDMGFLSSVAVKKIKVYKKLNITIISTGDEIIDDEKDYSLGKIRDINTNLLIGLVYKYNFNVVNTYLIKDDEKKLEDVIKTSMENSNIVVVSGGSSKGKKDTTSLVIDRLSSSKVLTHGIAIKPGKPTITAYDNKSNTILVGLPGHPVATAILFRFIVVDVIYKLMGVDNNYYTCEGELEENLAQSPGRMTIQLVKVDESFKVRPIYGKSGLIHTLSEATGFIKLGINEEGLNKGEKVKVYYL